MYNFICIKFFSITSIFSFTNVIKMYAMNTFENPNSVEIKPFNNVEKTEKGFKFNIPACSVVHFAVK